MTAAWRTARLTGTLIAGMLAGAPAASAQGSGTVGIEPERLYGNTCAFCHSRPFPPFPAPELRGRNLDPATITFFVRHGPGAMAPFRASEISDEDLNRLGAWIAASPAPPKPVLPPMPPSQGAKP